MRAAVFDRGLAIQNDDLSLKIFEKLFEAMTIHALERIEQALEVVRSLR